MMISDDGSTFPHCAIARDHIAQAFAAINCLPHGTEQDAALLIEAQTALAAARISLDEWQEAHDPLYTRKVR